ncbi:putative Leucine-rich repeat protein kinase family protein [Hibiscus syriacus]|uniref:Leucine-rich repeat protein kinase family protein n=1 Tax=Hibiscus syriacus TaxID=106335 RepID=A0A6A2YAE2_HIBSY|nr:putative Leucine-rich repeat protein kinase family protein [Hibiscus syriacus]
MQLEFVHAFLGGNQVANGITRTTRDLPPSHYLIKIEAFSLLIEAKVEKYKSSAFHAGGHQWRLVLYPTGNKESNGNGYISLYLEIENTGNLSLDWEVNVEFKLFVFDQIRDLYMAVKDIEVPVRRFYELKTKWGFSQFLSQEAFNNVANGYLVDDCCILGAEVFVIQRPLKLEKSVLQKPAGGTITWMIENFSNFDKEFYDSPVVTIEDIKWNLTVYPKGNYRSKDTHLSVYLKLSEPKTLQPMREVFVKQKLRLRNQIRSNHLEMIGENSFTTSKTSWGYPKFVSLEDLQDSSKGYMVRDSLIVEAEFILISKVE